MTDNKEYSRRELLVRFAMLSSSSLLLGMTGCGGSSGPDLRAMYGPAPLYGPVAVPMYGAPFVPVVNHMSFLDSKSVKIKLSSQSVPVHTSLTINFNVDFNTSAPATVTFTDASGNAVPNTQAWENSRTLSVTPSADLAHDTTYTLSIDEVTDSGGVRQNTKGAIVATFKTVHNVTISQGIWGSVSFWEGDFMPGNPSGTITPVIREIFIHKVTTVNDIGSGPLFANIPTDLVATVSSDATGFYEVEVGPGTYSVFVKEDASFYANGFDGQGQIQPVEVTANTVSELQIDITHKASF